MLAGILLHATSVQEVNDRLFMLIADISHNFRMGAFFAVAGVLSMTSVQRRGSDAWLARRLFQIGIPTIFGLLVICPLMSSLYTWRVEGSFVPAGPSISWWHFWFLVALLVYAPITFLAGRLDKQRRIFARIDEWANRTRLPPLIPILAIGGACYALAITHQTLVGLMGPAASPLQDAMLISAYAPLYFAGVVLGGAPGAFRKLTSSIAAPLVVLIGLAAMMLIARSSATLDRDDVMQLQLITISFCPVAMAVLILRSAAAMSRVPPILARFSEAAFTIYIVHYSIILALDDVLDPLRLNHYLSYALTVGGTAWLSYMIHFGLVRRSRIAALLLNGRSMKGPRVATA